MSGWNSDHQRARWVAAFWVLAGTSLLLMVASVVVRML